MVEEEALKAVILGVDGVSWSLIRPFIDEGLMPNFKRLIDEGAYGTLRSVIPPVTAPAWVSFATGVNPGKHSVFNFILPKKSLEDLETVSSKNIQVETFYEVLHRNQLKSILINLPGTFPPKIDAPIITSLMTKGDNPVFPPSLLDEIPELKNYRIVPDMSLLLEEKLSDLIDDIRNLEKHRFICAQKLFEREWDVFFLMFSGTDWVQHIFPELSLGETSPRQVEISKVKQLFAEIDSYFGWFIDRISDEMALFALSDHGFKVFEGTFQVNRWLAKEGYLATKEVSEYDEVAPHKVVESMKEAEKRKIEKAQKEWEAKRRQELEELKRYEDDLIKRRIILPATLVEILRKAGLGKIPPYLWVKRVLGLRVQKLGEAIDVDKILERERLGWRKIRKKISAPETSAACLSYESSGIYINKTGKFTDGIVDEGEYDEVCESLIQKLQNLTHPISGKPIFAAVLRKEEVWWGPYVNLAPDIVLLRGDFEVDALLEGEVFSGRKVPGHSNTGIVLAFGKDIKNIEIKGANIVDVVPTLLHFLGVELPRDMDGKVLLEIFSDGSKPRKRRIVYESDSESRRLRKKVKRIVESDKM